MRKLILCFTALALALAAAPARAVVTGATTEVSYTGNGATTAFGFTFKATDKAWVKVYVGGVLQASGFTAALNTNQDTAPGGTVTFSSAPASGEAVKLRRELPLTQPLVYRDGDRFPAKSTEGGLDRAVMLAQQLARDIAEGKIADNSSVTATGTTTPRPLKDRFAEKVNVVDFGASPSKSASENAAAIRRAINAINAMGQDTQTLYFPPAADPYLSDPIVLTGSDRQIIFEGDSLRGSRIKIATAGTYGIAFTSSSNSWGGFRNIRVETDQELTSVIYVQNPSNAFVADHLFVSGGNASSYCLTIDGISGVGFTGHWIYSTGATVTNYRHVNLTSEQFVVYMQGNSDVGGSGILSVSNAAGSGGSATFIGTRFEHVNAKKLFQFNTSSASWLRLIATQFTNTAGDATPATAVVSRAAGSARPTWYLDVRFQVTPTNIYVDDGNAGNNIAAATRDLTNPITDNAVLIFGSHRVWVDATGRVRKVLGATSSDTAGIGLSPRVVSATYGTSIAVDVALGSTFKVTPTDGAGFTVAAPTNGYTGGQRITITIANSFGALGAATFAGSYHLAGAWTQPANGNRRSITFEYDGGTLWHEVSRTAADVPN
jgi:hypothetical protein